MLYQLKQICEFSHVPIPNAIAPVLSVGERRSFVRFIHSAATEAWQVLVPVQ